MTFTKFQDQNYFTTRLFAECGILGMGLEWELLHWKEPFEMEF